MQSAQTELDFINLFLESLSSKSVRYGDDYMSRKLPSPLRIKRVPTCPIIEKEPTLSSEQNTPRTITNDKIQVTIKVLKPASSFTIGSLSTDNTVLQLKQRIYQQQSSLPVNRQRLLIKGKVLADQKTLGELSITENNVIHLMVTSVPAASAAPVMGRFGVSAESEQKMSNPEFWCALEKTIVDQLGETDAKLVFSKVKATLTA